MNDHYAVLCLEGKSDAQLLQVVAERGPRAQIAREVLDERNKKRPPSPHAIFTDNLEEVLGEIEDFLLGKNRKYGNSALEPIRCFSKLGPLEGINIRIDDKIKRLMNQKADDTEDTELDLLGYLILKRVLTKQQEKEGGNG